VTVEQLKFRRAVGDTVDDDGVVVVAKEKSCVVSID
jgi:hypothetical protein